MKKYIILIFLLLISPTMVDASRGCCSRNGGVCGCNASGKQVCCNGDESRTCTCTPPRVYGCTDYNANNYNPRANTNDGSCTYTVKGCTDSNANNYNANANTDDGSCTYDIVGCMDKKANNYDEKANKDSGACTYDVYGCMDSKAKNYNEKANKDDKSCVYEKEEEIIPLSDLEDETGLDDLEEEKEQKISIPQSTSTIKEEDSNETLGILGLVSLGAGSYAAYSYKKKEEERKRLEALKNQKGLKKLLSIFKKK